VIILFGVPLNSNIVIVSVLLLLLLLLVTNKKKEVENFNIDAIKSFLSNKHKMVVMIATIVLFSLVLIVTCFWPITEWDALTLYDFRGRLFSYGYLLGDLAFLDSFDSYNPGYYFSYPPATSLMHASYYLIGSNYPQVMYPVLFFSLAAFFFSSLSRHVSSIVSIVLSLSLVSVPLLINHSMIPYTNLPYAFFYFVSVVYILRFFTDDKWYLLYISSLFLAASSWIRFVEPFYLVNLITLFCIFIYKKNKIGAIFLYALPVLAVRFLWNNVQSHYAEVSFLNNFDVHIFLNDLIPSSILNFKMVSTTYLNFIILNISIFWLLLINTLISLERFAKDKFSDGNILICMIYLDLSVIFVGTLVIGVLIPGRSEIYNSIQRFGIFIYPQVYYLSFLQLKYILRWKKADK